MKLINKILLLIVICLSIVASVEAQETMYIYKNGAIVNEYTIIDVDSIIFYKPNTITDYEGNIYKTVVIGNQTWMAENLKATKLNDGTAIPNITDNTLWSNATSSGYCWYNNNETYKQPYGALYNWYAVSTGKLCPSGWHVPTSNDLTILITNLGGENIAGGKLKEIGNTHWNSTNIGANNESGFTGIAGGYRGPYGIFDSILHNSSWWLSSSFSSGSAYIWNLDYNDTSVGITYYTKIAGSSIRCIKD